MFYYLHYLIIQLLEQQLHMQRLHLDCPRAGLHRSWHAHRFEVGLAGGSDSRTFRLHGPRCDQWAYYEGVRALRLYCSMSPSEYRRHLFRIILHDARHF